MNFDKEVIIKRKIAIGDILILVVLFVFSFACIYGVLDEGLDTNIELLILGIISGLFFLLLFPYLLIKKDYLRINNQGIFINRSLGYKYGKEVFIAWNRIEAIIGPDFVTRIIGDEFQEDIINVRTISKLDKFNGFTSYDYENEAEWLENGIYLSTKEDNNNQAEMYEIGSMVRDNSELEILKKMWISNIDK